MEPRQIKIEDATKEELLKFANEKLGLAKIHHATGRGKILAKIRQAWTPDYIELHGESDNAPANDNTPKPANDNAAEDKIRALTGGSSKGDPMVRMFINEAEGAGGQRPVFVSVNHVPFLIPRGEEVDVPYRFFLALKNAVGTIYEQDTNTYEVPGREVPTYPYNVVRMPTPDEMVDWNRQELESQYPPGKAPPMAVSA